MYDLLRNQAPNLVINTKWEISPGFGRRGYKASLALNEEVNFIFGAFFLGGDEAQMTRLKTDVQKGSTFSTGSKKSDTTIMCGFEIE